MEIYLFPFFSRNRLFFFKVKNGCPAILVYRGGELLSSFISVTNKLGDDFVASDVESFLQE
jgi:hypothetical protein